MSSLTAVVLAVIAGMVASFSCPAAWAQSDPTTQKIAAVSQQTYAGAVAQADSGLQRPIKFGSPVFVKETVRTGADGSTELQFLDEARLHIGANASVQLEQYAYDETSGTGSGLIQMFVGAYDFVSGRMKTDDKVKLVTPTVTIGLRGTALTLYVAGDGRTDITVKEGLVSLAPCKFGVVAIVSAGQAASVNNSCQVTFPGAEKPLQKQPRPRHERNNNNNNNKSSG